MERDRTAVVGVGAVEASLVALEEALRANAESMMDWTADGDVCG